MNMYFSFDRNIQAYIFSIFIFKVFTSIYQRKKFDKTTIIV